MTFSPKSVLVTGASRGIGRGIAHAYAGRGFRVVAHYHRGRRGAEETVSALAGGGHSVLQADLGDPGAVRDLVPSAVAAAGRLDVLVNNAGIFLDHPPGTADPDAWEDAWTRVVQVNLLAPAHLMFHAARHMQERGGGRIVNVSSRGAFRGEPTAPAYGASKAGLNSASQSVAKAMGRSGVLVYVVAPGWVETDMAAPSLAADGDAIRAETAIGRVATPEEIAETAAWLGTDAPESLTGCVIDANGGSYLRT